jgi:CheY-like chemotaxis protein
VLANDEQLVFATEEIQTAVGHSELFDIAQDVPATAPPDAPATLTLGFHYGETRETATIESSAKTLAKFQSVLFKLVLDQTSVTIKQSGESGGVLSEGTTGTLKIPSSRTIRLEWGGGATSLDRKAVRRFNTTKSSLGGRPDQPAVVLYTQQESQTVRTTVCFPSFRQTNLFGRYLQSSPEAGFSQASDQTPSSINLLLVDDDPADLEMAELMLRQQVDRLQCTTATSAPGGVEELQRGSFDCVVSDYDMPGTDGIEFLQQVRDEHPDLPFILFTGQGSEAVAKQALLSDVTDYVEKGIGTQQYEVLLSRLRKAMR